ncbi:uncharacterized protein K452DRAFT_57249 [Aplosporella prunicola CBS 121167]|uniref:Uncharacterized protein n=1 Tax=Aplosporella prunicola CBS 121167 TaxID=1176127 RepID=A0A6A6B778_9PEZI|nr:uncharacterized protein K452DRAFT_57249 [Aplosporella prunicola CBS 121167]KAF2139880.1 hypothetical protein K452DRAFT_57249 [Aplosporella prunicola CBS 121167]
MTFHKRDTALRALVAKEAASMRKKWTGKPWATDSRLCYCCCLAGARANGSVWNHLCARERGVECCAKGEIDVYGDQESKRGRAGAGRSGQSGG